MKKPTLALTSAIGVLAVLCLGAAPTDKAPEQRRFLFTYDLVLHPPQDATRIEAWIPVPSNIPGQSIGKVTFETSADYRFTSEPAYGNHMVHLVVEGPAAGPIEASMTVEVTRHEYRGTNSGQPHPRYLMANKLVPTDGLVARLSTQTIEKAAATTDMEKARAIYEYVTRTVSYDKSGTGWGRGDALFACDAKKGNCTDFHALFIAMTRAAGIPARFEIGFPLKEELSAGTVGGYHCWAEFYIKGRGWIPVDSSEAHKDPTRHEYYFGALDPHRVEFTKGRDLVLSPPQQGEPLNYFVYPYIEIDGKPLKDLDRVKLKFSYKNV
jgi:transglutaminase-like putative cysteine protease